MPEFDLDVLLIGGSGVDTVVRVPQLDKPVVDSHMVPMVQTRWAMQATTWRSDATP